MMRFAQKRIYDSPSENANTRQGDAEPPSHRRWPLLVATVLTVIGLALAACGTNSGTGSGPTPTATPNHAAVQVYFAKHPDTDNNPTAVFAVTRTTTATTTQERAAFALEEMLKGPTTAERAQGYYSPFDGQLALQSYCPGPFRDFDLTLDHKGATSEQGTATLQFCRRVDIPGDLDGPRMKSMVGATLMQFASIKKVVILNYQGDCFDDMQGANACLDGAQTGYPVQVYFSRHPESDSQPAAVFAVKRTSPTLGVATFAIEQLIAGPTPQEQQRGYFTPLVGALHGESVCAGADILITLDKNRTQVEVGTATLRFCRDAPGFGDTGAAMVRNEIVKTLTQFTNIKKVVIVYKDGSCFDDLIGCAS